MTDETVVGLEEVGKEYITIQVVPIIVPSSELLNILII